MGKLTRSSRKGQRQKGLRKDPGPRITKWGRTDGVKKFEGQVDGE